MIRVSGPFSLFHFLCRLCHTFSSQVHVVLLLVTNRHERRDLGASVVLDPTFTLFTRLEYYVVFFFFIIIYTLGIPVVWATFHYKSAKHGTQNLLKETEKVKQTASSKISSSATAARFYTSCLFVKNMEIYRSKPATFTVQRFELHWFRFVLQFTLYNGSHSAFSGYNLLKGTSTKYVYKCTRWFSAYLLLYKLIIVLPERFLDY